MKIKISDILRVAADYHLHNGVNSALKWNYGTREYESEWTHSCVAITCALLRATEDECLRKQLGKQIEAGLEEMGMPDTFGDQFTHIKNPVARQSARYIWLKLAALMAEEQGL